MWEAAGQITCIYGAPSATELPHGPGQHPEHMLWTGEDRAGCKCCLTHLLCNLNEVIQPLWVQISTGVKSYLGMKIFIYQRLGIKIKDPNYGWILLTLCISKHAQKEEKYFILHTGVKCCSWLKITSPALWGWGVSLPWDKRLCHTTPAVRLISS